MSGRVKTAVSLKCFFSCDPILFPIRFSLDASELGSDTEKEEEKETSLPHFSPPLSWSGLETWHGSGVIKAEAEPLCQNMGLVEKPGNVVSPGCFVGCPALWSGCSTHLTWR